MIAHQRHQKIKELLQAVSFQTVEALAQKLSVSVATVRRDLVTLAERSEITRVHGGAVSPHFDLDQGLIHRHCASDQEDLGLLARAAIDSIQEGETVALDSGPTVMELAKLLPQKKRLTVLVSSIVNAWNLRNARHLKILFLGGEMLTANRVNRGTFALKMLEQMYFDKVFIDVTGIDADKGLTIEDPAEAAVKKTLMKQSKEVILMADHTVIGHTASVKLGEAAEVNRIITTSGAATAPSLEKIRNLGVTLTQI